MQTKLLLSLVLSLICLPNAFGSNESMLASNAKAIVERVKNDHAKLKIVNLWASWCAPCRKELPAFAKTEKSFKDVRFYYVSGDDEKDAEKAYEFIQSTGVQGAKLRLSPTSEEAFHEFSPKWSGSLPFTFVFFNDQLTDLIGRPATESLLKQTIAFRLAHPPAKHLPQAVLKPKIENSQGKK